MSETQNGSSEVSSEGKQISGDMLSVHRRFTMSTVSVGP